MLIYILDGLIFSTFSFLGELLFKRMTHKINSDPGLENSIDNRDDLPNKTVPFSFLVKQNYSKTYTF